MSYRNVFVVLSACLPLVLISAYAAEFTLVKDGQPTATIVISQEALTAEPYNLKSQKGTPAQKVKLAAIELQRAIEKMSGAKLTIAGDAAQVAGPVILVGPSAKTAALKVAIPSGLTNERREEGYVIFCRGNALLLAGNDAGPYHGTLYAVYEFLNRLGARWFMPGEFGEYLPEQKTISFGEVSFSDKPGFVQRCWWMNQPPELAEQELPWKVRNKMNPAVLFAIPGDSSLRNFLPDEKFLKTNPEYFARNLDQTVNEHMPSLSHPAVPALVAEKLKAAIKKQAAETGEPPHSIGIAPDDGRPMDLSPETMKINQGFTSLIGRAGVQSELNTSEEWLGFINKVAAEVAKEYPNVIIATNGYANRDMPPEGIELHPNLSIMFAAIWADSMHAFDNPRSWQDVMYGAYLKRWCELNKRVTIYEYEPMLVSALTPLPAVRKIAHNYPLMKKWGMLGFINEDRNSYMECGITTKYIRAKMMWDPDMDVKAALDDYFSKWYGKAAKPSAAFWDAIEDSLEKTTLMAHEDRLLPYVYSPELLATLEKCVKEAEALADTDRSKLHVHVDRLILEHLKGYMAMCAAEFDGNYAECVKQADKMFECRAELNKISPFINYPEKKGGIEQYYACIPYYNLTQRKEYFQTLADMTGGKTGELVALAPKEAKFRLDKADAGRGLKWHAPEFDRTKWGTVDTTKPYYIQGYSDAEGMAELGLMWYVFEVDVPAKFKGKPVTVYSPVVTCEAWAWVNGRYVGHRPYRESYERPIPIEFDATAAIVPGKKNVIAVRVDTGFYRSAVAEGFQGRLFLYSPKPPAK